MASIANDDPFSSVDKESDASGTDVKRSHITKDDTPGKLS